MHCAKYSHISIAIVGTCIPNCYNSICNQYLIVCVNFYEPGFIMSMQTAYYLRGFFTTLSGK